MNVVLNGKKADNMIFSKVDPGTIQSINIARPEELKKLSIDKSVYPFNNDSYVIS
ncbi:hypothetical protein NAF17_07425 [Mucilaginibacter sp. RB4R14]|uniref:hypothetical protein n=1 Tax=Mucilaginibacter aurantiaciroseus TaxID=2949308 RepID=UPI00209043E8|nr:hypothetical protein [Mucilaginibacter aurantiaciroseus]MCO5935366.1 hypothetical protein [Mucilaginibacter aurantiaciroseus]